MKIPAVVLLVFWLLAVGSAVEAETLHDGWSELLTAHVEEGRVDYQGFKRDEEKLDIYLALLAAVSPASLDREARLAFYINVYNSYTVKLILDHFSNGVPVKSIKDIGGLFSSPWSIRFVDVGGEKVSLDTVEHEIIRPQFREPRIHFAVNCASRGCPPLMNAAYTGAALEQQLEANTRAFLNNPQNTRLKGDTLYVSKIFRWFAEDFNDNITGFIKRYADEALLAGINGAGSSLRVKYLTYDWSLNE